MNELAILHHGLPNTAGICRLSLFEPANTSVTLTTSSLSSAITATTSNHYERNLSLQSLQTNDEFKLIPEATFLLCLSPPGQNRKWLVVNLHLV